jgi:hypothetical protein
LVQVSFSAVDVLRMSRAVNDNIDDYGSGEGARMGGKEAGRQSQEAEDDIEMRDFGTSTAQPPSESPGGSFKLSLSPVVANTPCVKIPRTSP